MEQFGKIVDLGSVEQRTKQFSDGNPDGSSTSSLARSRPRPETGEDDKNDGGKKDGGTA